MRWKYIFREKPDEENYVPGLYINSERDPDPASEEIERCLDNLEISLESERRKQRRKMWPNLSPFILE